jgi:hypothetical protein
MEWETFPVGTLHTQDHPIMTLFNIGQKFKPRNVCGMAQSRFIEPHDCEEIAESRIKYDNAQKLASDIGALPLNFRAFVFLDGKFIFGDFLEALIVDNDWHCEELTISTLSMSRENIDSLANLVNGDYLKQLNLIVSHYYFATERQSLMPYVYEQLDKNDILQLAVASVHTKIAMIRTTCGKKITIHGSANLRTSSNIEQIVIEHTPSLFDFCAEVHHNIISMHKTINKPVRRTLLWQQVLAQPEKNSKTTTPECQSPSKSEQQPGSEALSAAQPAHQGDQPITDQSRKTIREQRF